MPTTMQRRVVLMGGQTFFNGSVNVPYSAYSLLDIFSDGRAAGAVNGTLPVVGGARVVTDTNSKLSSAGGVASFATGGVGSGDPGLWYASQARAFGRAVIATMNMSVGPMMFGWDSAQAGLILDAIRPSTSSLLTLTYNGTQITVGAASTGTDYQLAVVMRSVGMYYFIKGGAFTNWTLVWQSAVGSAAGFPAAVATAATSVFTADNIRIPLSLYTGLPYLAYDTFTRADGALGQSETSGPDNQAGTARAWTVQTGTIAIVTNKASVTAAPAIATAPCVSADVLVDAAITRTAGSGGIVLRYADANNYLRATTEGTNCLLEQVVAGTPTTLRTGAVTYGAGNVIRVIVSGTTGWLFYNGAAVGASFTVPSSSATAHGMYGDDVSVLCDNFQALARGTANEYAYLDTL